MTKITEELVIPKLPNRPKDANKGTFGKALIIAGSKNYPGAAILSCLACARSGAGLVTLATDEDTYKVAVPKIPFATFLDFSEVEDNLEKYDTVLVGPGLGNGKRANQLINKLVNWNFKNKKLIIDADGLNILSGIDNWYRILAEDAVLTPHPGEMSRLTRMAINKVQDNREKVAEKFAKEWNKTIILKGAETIIANPNGQVFVSPFSNPLLATAGTGDVLAGIIVGLLAQGLNLICAAVVGVYMHGLAGEKLKERFNDRGATAEDLIGTILITFKTLNRRPSD